VRSKVLTASSIQAPELFLEVHMMLHIQKQTHHKRETELAAWSDTDTGYKPIVQTSQTAHEVLLVNAHCLLTKLTFHFPCRTHFLSLSLSRAHSCALSHSRLSSSRARAFQVSQLNSLTDSCEADLRLRQTSARMTVIEIGLLAWDGKAG